MVKKIIYYPRIGAAMFLFFNGIMLYTAGCCIRAAGKWLMNLAITICPDMVEKYQ